MDERDYKAMKEGLQKNDNEHKFTWYYPFNENRKGYITQDGYTYCVNPTPTKIPDWINK
jgi:hypothetical protein